MTSPLARKVALLRARYCHGPVESMGSVVARTRSRAIRIVSAGYGPRRSASSGPRHSSGQASPPGRRLTGASRVVEVVGQADHVAPRIGQLDDPAGAQLPRLVEQDVVDPEHPDAAHASPDPRALAAQP